MEAGVHHFTSFLKMVGRICMMVTDKFAYFLNCPQVKTLILPIFVPLATIVKPHSSLPPGGGQNYVKVSRWL